MLIVFTISVVFIEATFSREVTGVQIWAVIWLLTEIIVNFIRVTYGQGYNKLEKIS